MTGINQPLPNITEEEKIDQAKKNINAYLDIMQKLSQEEKAILAKALSEIEGDKIDEVKQQLMDL